MTTRLLLAALTAVIFYALPAASAEGDECPASVKRLLDAKAACYVLCENRLAEDADCDEFFMDIGKNWLTQVVFEIADRTSCTAGTVDITHASSPSATVQTTIGSLNLTGGTTMIVMDAQVAQPMRYINATLTGEADCNPGADVYVHWK